MGSEVENTSIKELIEHLQKLETEFVVMSRRFESSVNKKQTFRKALLSVAILSSQFFAAVMMNDCFERDVEKRFPQNGNTTYLQCFLAMSAIFCTWNILSKSDKNLYMSNIFLQNASLAFAASYIAEDPKVVLSREYFCTIFNFALTLRCALQSSRVVSDMVAKNKYERHADDIATQRVNKTNPGPSL